MLPLKNGYPHYLPLSRYWQTRPRRGREVIHYFQQIIVKLTFCSLFLKDAGLDYKEVLYPYDNTWAETSKKLRERGLTRTGQLPTLEYGGSVITQVRWISFAFLESCLMVEQHIPILRYLSRDLGAYDGNTNWEKYLVDAVADIYIDWRVCDQRIQVPSLSG